MQCCAKPFAVCGLHVEYWSMGNRYGVQTFAIKPLVQIGVSVLQPFLAFLGRTPIFAILRPSAWGTLSDSLLRQEERALAGSCGWEFEGLERTSHGRVQTEVMGQ